MGGGTSSYQEIEETDCILLWGSNARETHPIFFHHLLAGLKRGAKLYAIDPRRTASAQWADVWAGLDVGTDIALVEHHGARDHHQRPGPSRVHRARHDRVRRLSPAGRALDARARRRRDRRAGGGDPRDGAHLRAREARHHLLDAGHHRASHRRPQRDVADQSRPADRPRRPMGVGPQPAPRPEQRAGRRRHGRAAGSPARVPARRERRGAGEVRSLLRRGRAAEEGVAPVGHVRRHGAARVARPLCNRREPGAVGSRPAPRDEVARGPRVPGGAGHFPDRNRAARRRGVSGGRRRF